MRNALLAGLVLVAAAALSACGGGGSKGGACGASCNGCCLGTTCVAGTDPTGCGSGSNNCAVCTSSQICKAGLCQAGGAVADKCATNGDCSSSLVCAPQVPGGGYCTANCATTACPGTAICVTESDGSKDCEKSCTTDGDCRSEHLCFHSGSLGVCRPKCTGDIDCNSRNCDTGTGICGASRIGNACTADTDCGQPPAVCDKSTASGSCSVPCGGDQQASCPQGTSCVSGGGSASCQKNCAGPGDCRSGFNCADNGGGVKTCLPACSASVPCPGSKRCDTGTSLCVEGGPAAGHLGGACAGSADCTTALGASAVCFYPFAGGYCSIHCGAQADCAASNSTCVGFTDGSQDCLSKCSVPSDCRGAYYCFDLGPPYGGVCLAKCQSDNNCGTGKVCDRNGGLCVDPGTLGNTTVSTFNMTPNGPIELKQLVLNNPATQPLKVDAPADAVSVNFIGRAVSDPTARVIVYRIFAPDGTLLYDYAKPSESKMKVLPSITPGVYSVMVPNTPNVPLTAGTYTIQIVATKDTSVTASALIKHSQSQALLSGSIDMNLFFVGLGDSNGLDAARAQSDANFKSVLDKVAAIWVQDGVKISIGKVKYIDLSASDAAQFRDLKETDLGAMMTRSDNSAAAENALNVFFVHTISGGTLDGFYILGESAGIPGAPVRGSTGSGLAVTAADYAPSGASIKAGALDLIADVWAHEGSHWLGLFHTTEASGTDFDPLDDTAMCPAVRDTDNDTRVDPEECSLPVFDGGADNEMFWTGKASIPHTHLTPNQGYVLLRNPAVH